MVRLRAACVLLLAAVGACGAESELTIVETSPSDGDDAVEPEAAVRAVFNRAVSPESLNGDSFQIVCSGRSIIGTVSYDEDATAAVFDPGEPLDFLAACTATVTAAVKTPAGAELATDYAWSFAVRDRAWATATAIQSDDQDASYSPRVAVDSQGNATAIWKGSTAVKAARYSAGGWQAPITLQATAAGPGAAPRVAFDAVGNGLAIFEGELRGVWASRFEVGSGWQEAQRIDEEIQMSVAAFRLAMAPSGTAFAIWTYNDGTRTNVRARRFVPESGWGLPELVENSAEDVWPTAIDVGIDEAGNAIAVWTQDDGTRNNAWGNRYQAAAGWGMPQLLEDVDGLYTDGVRVAMGPDGDAVVVWRQFSDPGGGDADLWVTHYDVAAGWGTAELLEADARPVGGTPAVAVDQQGNAVAVWNYVGLSSEPPEIVGRRFVPGEGWGAEEPVGGPGGGAVLGLDAHGDGLAVWDYLDQVWASRYLAGRGWSAQVRIEDDEGGYLANSSELALAETGDCFAVWIQSDTSYPRVWGARFH